MVTVTAARATVVRRRRWTPDGLIAALAALAALGASAWRPLLDIDVFWHVLVGRQILDGVPVTEAGRGWSIAPVPDTWVSTQWLTEVVFALLLRLDGWTGLLWWRYLTVALALVALALTTFRGRSVRAGAVPFAIGACALAGYSQERTAQVTFVLAPVLGWVLLRALRTGVLPRWWVVLPVAVLWTNLHGGWVLAAAVAALVVVGRVLDHGWRDPVARQAAGLGALVLVAACVCPLGPANLLSPWRFAQAASVTVLEWQRTVPWDVPDGGLLWSGMLVAWLAAWVLLRRARVAPPRSELLVVLALLAFGLMAWRNVPVVVLLLGPLLAARLGESWPSASRAAQGGPTRWSSLLPLDRVGLVLAVAGAGLMLPVVGRHGELPAAQPVVLARLLAERTGPVRVLVDYNASGIVLLCGGAGHALVSIDGRTERHGADYLREYQRLMDLGPGWQGTFDALAPDAALLANATPLAHELTQRRGWRVVASTSAGYLLLVPPTPGNAAVVPVQPAARTDASCTAPVATASSPSSPVDEAAPATSDHTSASRFSTTPASRRAEAASVTGNGGS